MVCAVLMREHVALTVTNGNVHAGLLQVTIRQALEVQHGSTPAAVAAVLAVLESPDFQFDAHAPADGLFLELDKSDLAAVSAALKRDTFP